MIATTPHAAAMRSNYLSIRTATGSLEISQLRAVLDEQHYLKADRPAGHVLWQGAWKHNPESGLDRLVAFFCWVGAASVSRTATNGSAGTRKEQLR